jgi:hypothetical protein
LRAQARARARARVQGGGQPPVDVLARGRVGQVGGQSLRVERRCLFCPLLSAKSTRHRQSPFAHLGPTLFCTRLGPTQSHRGGFESPPSFLGRVLAAAVFCPLAAELEVRAAGPRKS